MRLVEFHLRLPPFFTCICCGLKHHLFSRKMADFFCNSIQQLSRYHISKNTIPTPKTELTLTTGGSLLFLFICACCVLFLNGNKNLHDNLRVDPQLELSWVKQVRFVMFDRHFSFETSPGIGGYLMLEEKVRTKNLPPAKW